SGYPGPPLPRRPRLQLRPARELRRPERRARLDAHAGVFPQASGVSGATRRQADKAPTAHPWQLATRSAHCRFELFQSLRSRAANEANSRGLPMASWPGSSRPSTPVRVTWVAVHLPNSTRELYSPALRLQSGCRRTVFGSRTAWMAGTSPAMTNPRQALLRRGALRLASSRSRAKTREAPRLAAGESPPRGRARSGAVMSAYPMENKCSTKARLSPAIFEGLLMASRNKRRTGAKMAPSRRVRRERAAADHHCCPGNRETGFEEQGTFFAGTGKSLRQNREILRRSHDAPRSSG